jgi:hypothetical protein
MNTSTCPNMKTVNQYYLRELLGPLNTLGDEDVRFIGCFVDPNDEAAVKDVLRKHVLPMCAELSKETLDHYTSALRYYLTTRSAPVTAFISAQQESPLRCPADPHSLFLWVWELLCPGEDYLVTDLACWREENDPAKAISYLKRKPE